MKRILAALSAAAVVGGLLVASGPSQPAEAAGAANPEIFTVVCTSQSTFDQFEPGIGWGGNPRRVVSGRIDDQFRIQNTGSEPCAFSSGTALDTDSVAIASGTTRTVTIANSGSFTITPAGGAATTFFVDACSLTGSGIESDPWRVGTLADLVKVGQESTADGEASCSLAGHYLQTATISDVDTSANSFAAVVAGRFTGTYDGDHYGILFTSPGGSMANYANRPPLFQTLGEGGVIKRLSLGGFIKVDRGVTQGVSSLVELLEGGTISEVGSSVNIDAKGPSAIIGGLVATAGNSTSNTSQRIQYSAFGGRIDWTEDDVAVGGPTIGGLVGVALGTGTTEIRDSYSRAEVSFDSSQLTGTDPDSAIYAGGLLGSDGLNQLSALNTADGDRTDAPSAVRILRSYFAGSFRNTCDGTALQCNLLTGSGPSHVFTGGLIGVSEGLDDAGDGQVSAFWLSTAATFAVAEVDGVLSGGQPDRYTVGGFPQAARLSATLLRTLSTYQSKENSPPTDEPSGGSDLATAASAAGGSTLSEQDYRWAIEAGNVETFVASGYGTESNYLTRTVFNPTTVTLSYRREGAGDLAAHGGSDPKDVTGYPTLGRVWEICPGDYPVLVWEERNCAAEGGGDSGSSSTQASAAQAAGLSGAELAAFLASGLTLEQWMAQRLAATGTPQEALGQGLLVAALLALAGAGLMLGRRRLGFGSSR